MPIRNRIRELRFVPAGMLKPNPKNWRTHPTSQRNALSGLLNEIGYADALLARETPDGLLLIDGHLRAELTSDTEVPVLVLDVTEAEADKILLTLDPLAAMAEADTAQLEALLREVDVGDAALAKLLAELAGGEADPRELDRDDTADIADATPIDERWCVIVECVDEGDQQVVYERLQSEGRTCRLLML